MALCHAFRHALPIASSSKGGGSVVPSALSPRLQFTRAVWGEPISFGPEIPAHDQSLIGPSWMRVARCVVSCVSPVACKRQQAMPCNATRCEAATERKIEMGAALGFVADADSSVDCSAELGAPFSPTPIPFPQSVDGVPGLCAALSISLAARLRPTSSPHSSLRA